MSAVARSNSLDGKVVVVTGGAGALGKAFCAAIAERGGIPVVADRDLAAARALADALRREHDGRAEAVAIDITDKHAIDGAIAEVVQGRGRIDALVNNAYPRNANYGRRVEEVEYADFCDNLGMHLGGYFLASQRFAAHFRASGGGNIVNISSIYGVMAPRFELYEGTTMDMPVEYAAIKSGVLHLTRYFAKYFGADGIRVNAISPGGILAAQPDAFLQRYKAHCAGKGMLEARDVTGTLAFLLSDDSRYLTGQNLVVDDGFSL